MVMKKIFFALVFLLINNLALATSVGPSRSTVVDACERNKGFFEKKLEKGTKLEFNKENLNRFVKYLSENGMSYLSPDIYKFDDFCDFELLPPREPTEKEKEKERLKTCEESKERYIYKYNDKIFKKFNKENFTRFYQFQWRRGYQKKPHWKMINFCEYEEVELTESYIKTLSKEEQNMLACSNHRKNFEREYFKGKRIEYNQENDKKFRKYLKELGFPYPSRKEYMFGDFCVYMILNDFTHH